jgi:2-polyprenyl-3-methyl-5-hydroxy-6-metoxy-1,4-benzoquinol methylase
MTVQFFRDTYVFLNQHERDRPNELCRLDARYQAIIAQNVDAIVDARILDIASHNGRWTAACLAKGAQHVTGIEARNIRASEIHLKQLGFAQSQYHFIRGDVHQAIRNLKPGIFDTILCLGFFYHTAHHFALLEEFKRLDPRFLIIDSQVSRGRGKHIIFGLEDTSSPLAAASDKQFEWAGRMSRELLEESLKSFGFEYTYFDWENS